MSTSRVQAENDLTSQLPSCSYSLSNSNVAYSEDSPSVDMPLLCPDVLIEIFKKATKSAPIKQQLILRQVCSLSRRIVAKEMSVVDELRVEIKMPTEFRIQGPKRVWLDKPEPNIVVQNSHVNSIEEAIFLVRQALKSMKSLRKLILHCADPEQSYLEAILDEVLQFDRVHLEHLQLRRRRGGVSMPRVVSLVKKNASTLKVIGQIGLTEAAEGFEEGMCLDRLHLNTFDLGFDCDEAVVNNCMLKIMQSGVTTKHLSFSSFIGFDPTEDLVQRFLASLDVHSLRLTMMRGPCILPQPDYMVGKVRQVEHIELVEVVEKTNIFNSLCTYEKMFKKVFPNIEYINYSQDWSR